jgi:Polyketide cyclase / dehydrase and lipid transport
MPRFELQTEIAAPADEVFEYVSNFERSPEWQRGAKDCHWTSPPPRGVGSTYEQVTNFMGKDIAATFEVVEYEPGRRVRVECREGGFPLTVERSAEPKGEQRCVYSEVVEVGDPGLYSVDPPLLRTNARRFLTADHRRLRERFSSGES